ncbi:tyrosine-protein kinase transmembrane receptor Ror-like isoform X2 [Prorops nasuta]|uniref:tyrosine-protein kinase transmembrane receptor Ror-like isoform X2 n=1 Tax=Prorops nasuta TaxID=863751 RepID=UPI0034CE9E54
MVEVERNLKMDRPRLHRRRGASFAETQTASNDLEEKSNLVGFGDVADIRGCKDNPQICGKEAACKSVDAHLSKCVCPHDLSPPTIDLKCPNRLTVPLTPRPIHNIILPSGNIVNTTRTLSVAEQAGRSRQKVPEIIGISVAVVAAIAIFLGLLYCIRRRNYGTKQKNTLDKGLLMANKYTPNRQYFACNSPEVPILARDSLLFLNDIGEGCFGKVYKGEWNHENGTETVAIKVLKDSASKEAEEDFMREVEIMSTFRHENILSLKGVVLRDSNDFPWMVFEYMPYGDLAEVLRANSRTLRSPIPGLQPLTKESLLWISMQVTAGMSYLSAQRFVHRDLACRNCLVGSGLVVKIADFGMSRDIYTCDYYKVGGSRLLPVRWMSPESVMYGRFTLESDIWSFGVVLWEIFSFGRQPYYGHNNEEVVKLILQGIMLIPPDECPPTVCQIMRECWKTDPRDRIKFPDVLERLEKLKEKQISQGSLPRPPQSLVTIRSSDNVDDDGYLLPAPAIPRNYIQPLPTPIDCPTKAHPSDLV